MRAEDRGTGRGPDRLQRDGPVGPLEEPRHRLDLQATFLRDRFHRLHAPIDRTRQDAVDRAPLERRHQSVRLSPALHGQRPETIVSLPLLAGTRLPMAKQVDRLGQPRCLGQHLSVALVRERRGSLVHRGPDEGIDLVIGLEVLDLVGPDQPVAHYLRTAEGVGVAHALELRSELARHPRLLMDLPQRRGLDRLSVVRLPLRQREVVVAWPVDDQRLEDPVPPTEDHATRRTDDVGAHQNRRFFFASDRQASRHAARVSTRTRSRPAASQPATNARSGSVAATAESLSIAITESWWRPSTS